MGSDRPLPAQASELLGVYREYERGKGSLDAAAICGDYHEVELKRMDILKSHGH